MRFIIGTILIALLSAVAQSFMPWWSIAITSFIVAFFSGQGRLVSFSMGFIGIAIFWLDVAFMHDVANAHLLSTRMATLFHLPNYGMFLLATVVVGGLVGGLSALAGAVMRAPQSTSV